MRFIFLTNYFPPHHRGGYEELCEEVALEFTSRGHSVRVVTTKIHHVAQKFGRLEVQRILYPEVGSRMWVSSLEYFYAHRRRVEENRRLWDIACQEFDPDVILVWGMWNLPVAMLEDAEIRGNPPVVYYIADYWPTLPEAYHLHWQSPARKGLTQPFKSGLSRLALSGLSAEPVGRRLRFEHAICVSRAVRDELTRSGLLNSEACVIYNGISVEDFPPRPLMARQPVDPLKLVYAGRLAPEKGVHTALKALSLVESPAQLTIIGSGDRDYENELRVLVEQSNLHDRVIFKGRIPRSLMANELAHHDVFLLPAEWPEPIPRALQEAMAIGLAVIASRIGGIPEIIINEVNGILCPIGEPVQMAKRITLLADNPDRIEQLAAQARQTIEGKFTLRRMMDELEDYLYKIVNSRQQLP